MAQELASPPEGMDRGTAARMAQRYRTLARLLVNQRTGDIRTTSQIQRELGMGRSLQTNLRNIHAASRNRVTAEWVRGQMAGIVNAGIDPRVRYRNTGRFEGFLAGTIIGAIEGTFSALIPGRRLETDLGLVNMAVGGSVPVVPGATGALRGGFRGITDPNSVTAPRPWRGPNMQGGTPWENNINTGPYFFFNEENPRNQFLRGIGTGINIYNLHNNLSTPQTTPTPTPTPNPNPGPKLPGGGGLGGASGTGLLGSNEGGGPSSLNMEATMQASYNPAGSTDLNLEPPMQEVYNENAYPGGSEEYIYPEEQYVDPYMA